MRKKAFCILLAVYLCFSIAVSASAARVPVILYHHITESYDEGDHMINITPQAFEQHLDALRGAGYKTITFDDYYNYVNNNLSLPYKPVIISFDDGYESNYIYAYPALKNRNMKATIFIVTSTVGQRENVIPHFTWEQAKEMENSGVISIQSHTHSHVELTGLSQGEVIKELRLSKFLIEENMGKKCDYVAFPYGLYNSGIYDAGHAAGFKLMCKVGDKGYNDKNSANDALKRVTVSGLLSQQELIELIETNLQ